MQLKYYHIVNQNVLLVSKYGCQLYRWTNANATVKTKTNNLTY